MERELDFYDKKTTSKSNQRTKDSKRSVNQPKISLDEEGKKLLNIFAGTLNT